MRKGTRMLALEHARRAGDMENRFRDRTGREHYDDGRFAPMRNDTNIEIEGRFRDDRAGNAAPGMTYAMETYGPRSRTEDWDRRGGGRMNYPGGPFPVYQQSDGMRGGGYDMNRIGFNANREWDSDRVGMNAGYESRNELEHRPGMRTSGGHASGMGEGMMEPMTKEAAEKWVRSMKGAAGGPGQHWTMEQAKQIMTRYGYQADPVEFYVALNMMKSDYVKAAQKVGADKEEFYAAMADAFLNDEDAKADKLALYHHYIAKKV